MHSVQVGMWDPQPPSKHVSPLPPHPLSNHRPTHVTTATPAKRITFYKSGDNRFGGVRMAIHRRSFKCFDALLDDLSQKVPLPFGVRTVTTPRGIHSIKHLEQLQDGGCYLCTDRRYAKPVNLEVASKRPNMWYHHGRRPHRPDASSTTPPGHPSHRQRRILLIKNTEPGMRRSVVLNRRSTRSLKAFLDEVSDVMQFHVRKLYTAEGRRIDSVQSLITCSGVLVCVGREAFSPMLVNFIRKSSDEKLPGLGSRSPGLGPRTPGNGARSPATQGARSPPHGAQSRTSEYSEGHESKKNVNFGLETKKSIIHPRSDSSNRSTRFSLSSEKSYGNGVSAYSRPRPAIINDDIEKRVLVNKDGSLSVEMKVRFRLHNDETVQWSTQIKKSPSLTNECCPLSQAQPHYLQQGQSESCSDPDSNSFDPDGVDYSNQPLQHVLDGSHCPCCYQRQEQQYDLWENPAHIHKQVPVPPPHTSSHTHTMMRHTHSSSSSSSCNSRRVVRCRARLSNSGGGSGSESQVVQEEMCVTEQVERRVEVEQDGDTHLEVCRVSRCCSRSEVVSLDGSRRPLSRKSEDGLMEEEERPLSGVSSSSHVLQSLKEDQDDEDDDLPPSASQCSHSHESSPTPSSQIHLSDKPASNLSTCSAHSKHKGSRSASAACSCHCGSATPHSTAEAEEVDRASSSRSKTSSKSTHVRIENSQEEEAADDGQEGTNRVVSGLSGDSQQSESLCSNCKGCKRNSASNSRASQRSKPHPASSLSNEENVNACNDDSGSDVSAVSTQSNKSNLTNCGRLSVISNVLDDRASKSSNPQLAEKEEERAPSAASAKSHQSSRSHKSACNNTMALKEEKRSPSSVSTHSNQSARSSKSQKSNCTGKAEGPDITAREEAEGENNVERAESALSPKLGASAESHESPQDEDALEENDTNEQAHSSLSRKSYASAKSEKEERPQSVLSAKSGKSSKSNVTAKSSSSRKSACSLCAREGVKAANEAAADATAKEEETEERAVSAMSAKSKLSAKSNKSCKSTKAFERSLSPRSVTEGDLEKRSASQMSARSVTSNASVKSKCNGNESVVGKAGGEEKVKEQEEQRPQTAASAKSENDDRPDSALSAKSQKSCCNDKSGEEPDTGDCEEDAKSAVSAKSHSNSTRTPSAMSAKSNASSNKSHKSQRLNRTAPSPNVDDAEVADVNEEQESANEEWAESVKSVKSSVRSSASQKSKNLKSASPSPNVITIKTPDGLDEEGNEEPERASSAASAKSGKSNKTDDRVDEENAQSCQSEGSHGQMLSPKRTRSPRIPKTPAPSPCSPQSAANQLLPGPGVEESRGPSALSIHSAKSGKSKCHCGATGARDNVKKKDKDVEKNMEEPVEKAESIVSSSKRHRKESGGTEQPPSPTSSGSVSLGLPEDQETGSDSGKSTASFHRDGERRGKAKSATADAKSTVSSKKGNAERAESKMSKINQNECTNNTPAIDIPTIETPGGGEEKEYVEQGKERAPSAFSSKTSKSRKSSCKCKIKAAADHNPDEQSSNKAENDLETVSMKSAVSNKDTSDKRSSSVLSTASAKSASKAKVKEDEDVGSLRSKSPCCLRPELAASAHSQKTASNQSKEEITIKGGDNGSIKSVKTSKSSKKENSRSCPAHSSKPISKAETHSESTLYHSLSAADLLKETMAATRPQSRQSKASKASDRPQSERSGKCQKSRNHDEEMTPACLPNASPNEVVSDWLRSIPVNSNMLALGDELNEEPEKGDKHEEEATKQGHENPETEGPEKMEEAETEQKEENEETAESEAADKEMTTEPAPNAAVRTSSRPSHMLTTEDSLPKSWHSSTSVMKVLLSSSLGRCRSMPEVSPVYGRRLSTSARGLLDCLAQLQLIEPAVNPGYELQKSPNGRYEDIMAILQSLWLAEPRDLDGSKDVQVDRVTPPRSSSGVGMSSGSGGSGKENETQREVETPPKEEESLHEDEAEDKGEEELGNVVVEDGEIEVQAVSESEANVAEDVTQTEEPSEEPQNQDSPKGTENPSSSDKSSANDSSKSHTDNERETPEDSSSSTPPTVLRAPLSKRLSQDPDPVWVLHLLKKLEKQFMNHYINAMAEFKVRWDLDDSLILDTMISELKDEVSRRIQNSVDREMRKIQSRAGKGGRSPRPPRGANLSRESTMTEKRRQMLKVMKNQSVKTVDSLSDGEMTGEYSDQRSDDEYCPCDACVRKKMAARPFKVNPMAAEAPVMMEFDLLKILQLKKSPAPEPLCIDSGSDSVITEEEVRNLEVVHEEEEEDDTKEDIKADVVLEETIPEEDENVGADEEEVEQEGEDTWDDEEQEGETGGDETSENGELEEECQCQCATKEERQIEEGKESIETAGEEEDEKGEDETGGEGEESDKETVKDAAEKSQDGEDGEEGDAGDVCEEEEEASDSTPKEDEELTPVEELAEGDVSASAEEGTEDSGTPEDEGESEEQPGEVSEEEAASSQEQGATTASHMTEGEEADVEDSDTDAKRQGDTSADESANEEARAIVDKEENNGEEEVVEDIVEDFKPEEEEGEEESGNRREDLLHQATRTSVESQSGSMEDIDRFPPPKPVKRH